jgi:hypothetical protein
MELLALGGGGGRTSVSSDVNRVLVSKNEEISKLSADLSDSSAKASNL